MLKDGDINDFGGGSPENESETYQTFKKYLLTFLTPYECDEPRTPLDISFQVDGQWYKARYGSDTFQILLNDLEASLNKLKKN